MAAFARGRPHAGVIFGASAGLIWAASDVAIKGSSGNLADHGLAVLVEPLAAVILIASLTGLLISAKSLQLGEAVPVIAVTASPPTRDDRLRPDRLRRPDALDRARRRLESLAFALVIGAAALTPAPIRAAEIEEELGVEEQLQPAAEPAG